MSTRKRRTAQRKIPPKWGWMALLLVTTILLHQIPRPLEVSLHLLTERLAFSLPGTEEILPLIAGLPLTSLELRGFPSLPLEVQEIQEGGTPLVSVGSRIVLQALSGEPRLTVAGEGLRLLRLTLASRAQVVLYVDQEHRILMQVQSPQVSQVELAVLDRFTLAMKDVVVRDTQKNEIPFLSSQPVHTWEVTPTMHNLVFEQEKGKPFGLVMDLTGRTDLRQIRNTPLAFASRLKVSHLDFTREDGNKRVSAIRRLWIEPLVPQESPVEKAYLQVQERDVFTLQTLHLSENGLECELTGRTSSLMVGKNTPQTNLVPSLLQYLVNHVVFKTVKELLGIGK